MTSDTLGERLEVRAQSEPARLDLPTRAAFWQWVWSAVRPLLGWILVAAGAVALFLGWFGVSGQALTAKQLPYLVSGGLVGIALFIIAAVFLATDDVRRQLGRLDALERKVDTLYRLLVSDAAEANEEPEPRPQPGALALPTGTSYHRPECVLIVGKPAARSVGAEELGSRRLRPCRVCEPDLPPPAVSGRRTGTARRQQHTG
ncbi:MAG TPA: hypothetical protein VNG13_10235 [Mycobacteriales bacterium]|nr:hypothetical protein [Mycobacteriales bacterium]